MVCIFIFAALLLPVQSLAGPASCAHRYYGQADCIAKCKQRWGYKGMAFGQNPWDSVIMPGSYDDTLQKACGTTSASPSASPISVPPKIIQVAEEPSLPPVVSSSPSPSPSITLSVQTSSAVVSSSSTPVPAVQTKETDIPPPPQAFAAETSKTLDPEPTTEREQPSPPPPPPPPQTTPTITRETQTTEEPIPSPSPSPPPPQQQPQQQPEEPKPSPTPRVSPNSARPPSSNVVSAADQAEYLKGHNDARARFSAQPLKWSDSLAATAQQWANNCVFEHSGGIFGSVGENLAAGSGSGYTISRAIASWVEEEAQYNPNNPVASHFTQVVWQSSTELGCAKASCDGIFDASFGKATMVVCHYNPPGNFNNEFAANVLS